MESRSIPPRTKSSPGVGLKKLSRQVSSKFVKPNYEALLPEEKLSLQETPIQDNEISWPVKVKSADGTKKTERLLVVGPKGCRILLPNGVDEVDNIPFSKMKEFSYNHEHGIFQISWFPKGTKDVVEIINLKTKNAQEIHDCMQKSLKEILRAKEKNPDQILASCTYKRTTTKKELKQHGRIISESASPATTKRTIKPQISSTPNPKRRHDDDIPTREHSVPTNLSKTSNMSPEPDRRRERPQNKKKTNDDDNNNNSSSSTSCSSRRNSESEEPSKDQLQPQHSSRRLHHKAKSSTSPQNQRRIEDRSRSRAAKRNGNDDQVSLKEEEES